MIKIMLFKFPGNWTGLAKLPSSNRLHFILTFSEKNPNFPDFLSSLGQYPTGIRIFHRLGPELAYFDRDWDQPIFAEFYLEKFGALLP